MKRTDDSWRVWRIFVSIALLCAGLFVSAAVARPTIRSAFFSAYPTAVGSRLDSVPSRSGHCGVCHYDFSGGGTRNPYGNAVNSALPNYPNTDAGRRDAILSIQTQDSDMDGYTSQVEITDVANYINTPTFPGLTAGNVNLVSSVALGDIQPYLTPVRGVDTTPPTVQVIAPNGGETLVGNASFTIQWTATDASGVAGVSILLSLDNGATFAPIVEGLPNTGSYLWFVPNRPGTQARVRVRAVDLVFNVGHDDSNAVFSIVPPPGGLVPSTLRDFDMPGSQPLEAGVLNPPEACAFCHGGYDQQVEPYFLWQGGMMAHASRDPLFEAALAIANQDAPDSGDLCLRCHLNRGWLEGRSVPTSGSQMLPEDRIGVSCDLCHRMVDPIPSPANPPQDAAILAALSMPPSHFGNGMFVIDPTGARRGPFVDADSDHPVLVSPFHREAALCGTCHDVSNPAFERDAQGRYVPNAFDAPAGDFSAHRMGPVERTYSEWFYSAYNTPGGVFAPQFGGNRSFVSTCQDCHMRAVTGKGCRTTTIIRHDLPLHDMTGGSTWLPQLLPGLYPGEVDSQAIQAGVARARSMLEKAATMTVIQQRQRLRVTVINETGHKLPTGYPEGRRIWLNVRFLGAGGTLLAESAAYDPATGTLGHDPQARIYEVEPATWGIPGLPDGTLFHFVLNNTVIKDNRIPPRGFTNAAYQAVGAAPVGAAYADGQFWDHAWYDIPPGAESAEVTLYYQSVSREFIEFLRDANVTNDAGQRMYDLWANNGRCPPEVMSTVTVGVTCSAVADFDADCDVDSDDVELFMGCRSGPAIPYGMGCQEMDFDDDGDVDQSDFGILQAAITGPLGCTLNAECDDGLHCNGAELCVAGVCQPGTPPDCSGWTDGCNIGSCNEALDACVALPRPDGTPCDNGDSCPGDSCQAGTCTPAVCVHPFTVLPNGVYDNRTGTDYYAGGPSGAAPMNDLRTVAEEDALFIQGNNANFWWEARFEDLTAGTLSQVQARVQLRREDTLNGTVIIQVYEGTTLRVSQSVPASSIIGRSQMAQPPTQVTVPVPAVEGSPISTLNAMKVRVYVSGGNNRRLYWSYAEISGLR